MDKDYICYDPDSIKEIEDSVDLIEYVSEELELKRKGKILWASCPFHTDITPSLAFYPEGNFYCFSCGRGGRIIQWLIEYEGLKFREALEKASRLANIDLSKICTSPSFMYCKKIKRMCVKHEKFSHPILPKALMNSYSDEVPELWVDEGIKPDVMKIFGVKKDNKLGRIIYPVCSQNGDFINIKGRTTNSDFKRLGIAKYINYYPVGVVDYLQGADVTLPYIKEAGSVIIFEGIKSVMKLYGYGIKNCVSAEKHNLTPEQISLLISWGVDVILAYDSDVSYRDADIVKEINQLKRFTNVYVIDDTNKLLGGAEAKNSPIDCGLDVWEELYQNKKKVR